MKNGRADQAMCLFSQGGYHTVYVFGTDKTIEFLAIKKTQIEQINKRMKMEKNRELSVGKGKNRALAARKRRNRPFPLSGKVKSRMAFHGQSPANRPEARLLRPSLPLHLHHRQSPLQTAHSLPVHSPSSSVQRQRD